MIYTATAPQHGLCPGSRMISVTRQMPPSSSPTISPMHNALPVLSPVECQAPLTRASRWTVSLLQNSFNVALFMAAI